MGLEIRWFFEGSTPSEVKSWFQDLTSPQFFAPAQNLHDFYLRNRDFGLGLKLREGRLEVKWRRRFGEFVGAGGKVKGQAEDWIEWVWTNGGGRMAGQVAESIRHDPRGPWIEVSKERLRLKHLSTENGLAPVRLDEQIERGCIVELTNVEVLDRRWWTLALDIFSQRGDTIMVLHQAAETLFTDYPGPQLGLAHSYGYPQWLSSYGVAP